MLLLGGFNAFSSLAHRYKWSLCIRGSKPKKILCSTNLTPKATNFHSIHKRFNPASKKIEIKTQSNNSRPAKTQTHKYCPPRTSFKSTKQNMFHPTSLFALFSPFLQPFKLLTRLHLFQHLLMFHQGRTSLCLGRSEHFDPRSRNLCIVAVLSSHCSC